MEYSYDEIGNRVTATEHAVASSQSDVRMTYGHGAGDAGPHAVTSAQVSGANGESLTYTYDAAGNRVRAANASVTDYVWDAEGELVAVDAEGGQGDASFVYDADGSRLLREDASGTTVYLPGGQEITIGTDGTVNASRYYTFGGQSVAVRTGAGMGAVTSLVNDAHGTPVAAIPNTDWSQKAVKRFYTDPFGATRGDSSAGTVPGERQFLGLTRDATTGLSLLGARYYDEQTGSFISVDPTLDLTDPTQWNAYAYANSNPVSRSDRTGLRLTEASADANFRSPTFYIEQIRQTEANLADMVRVSNAYRSARGLLTMDVPEVTPPQPCVAAGNCRSEPDFDNLREMGHGALDLLGLVPVLGEPADGINALWCVAEGDYLCATLSGGAMIPGIGWGAAAGTGVRAATDVAAKYGDDLAETAAKVCSFSGATLVLMADGSKKPIDQIKVGDKVLATDPETGEQGARKVTHVFVHEDTVTDLALDDGTVLGTTENHPFWSVPDGRFERADELGVGERVLTADGRTITVDGLRGSTARTAPAYNLSVDGIHTYHVGADAILVHNACVEPFLDDAGEAYARGKHTESGALRDRTKGYFDDDEDLFQLFDGAADFPAMMQNNGNCARVCNAGRDIGIDIETGLPPHTYTVISDRFGGVITMHPGLPR